MVSVGKRYLPVFDGHNDTFLDLFMLERGGGRSFFEESHKGHIDLPRARRGGLKGGIFSIYTPPPKSSPESDPLYALNQIKKGKEINYSPISAGYAVDFTNSILDFVRSLEKKAAGSIRTVKKYNDLLTCFKNNSLAIILNLEGAEAIDKYLGNLQEYYNRGLRSLGPVWSRPNDFGYGVPFKFPHSPDTGPGLTDRGKALVKECNRLGIMIDLSHINLKGFLDVVRLSDAPLAVTHSNVYSLCQSTRNLTDNLIEAVGESNGVIGISFVTENIKANGRPDPKTPLSSIIEHIDYVAQKIGIDHVALGSDFDGAEMPNCLKDVTKLPDLIQALRDKGYDAESLEKIAFRNWLRVFRDTWKD